MAVTGAWWNYVERGLIRTGATQTELAESVGVNRAALSRWRYAVGGPSVEVARRVARALDTPILDAFIAAGFITRKELGVTETPEISDVPSVQLLKELMLREENAIAEAAAAEEVPAPAKKAAARRRS